MTNQIELWQLKPPHSAETNSRFTSPLHASFLNPGSEIVVYYSVLGPMKQDGLPSIINSLTTEVFFYYVNY